MSRLEGVTSVTKRRVLQAPGVGLLIRLRMHGFAWIQGLPNLRLSRALTHNHSYLIIFDHNNAFGFA